MDSSQDRSLRRRKGKAPLVQQDSHQSEEEEEEVVEEQQQPVDDDDDSEEPASDDADADAGGAGPSSGRAKRRGARAAPPPAKRGRRSASPSRLGPRGGGGGGGAAGDADAFPAAPPGALAAYEALRRRYKEAAADATDRVVNGLRVNERELEALARLALRTLYFRHCERPGVPVPRAEVLAALAAAARSKAKTLPREALAVAQWKAVECLGLEVREIVRPPAARGGGARAAAVPGTGTPHLVLRSALPLALRAPAAEGDAAGDAERGFAALAMSLVELAGGRLPAPELWRLLEEVGVAGGGAAPHPALGRPAALLDRLVARRVLAVERGTGPDGAPALAYVLAEAGADEAGGAAGIKAWYAAECEAGEPAA